MRRPSLGVALGLCLLALQGAQAEEPALTVEHLVARFALRQETSMTFTEERHLQHLTEPLVSEGRLTFKPPRYLEQLVLQPKWTRVTFDGDLLIVQENEWEAPVRLSLSDYPALEAMTVTLRALLSGNAVALQRHHEVRLSGEDAAWSMQLIPRAKAWIEVVREVLIVGSGRDISSITLTEADGDRSVTTIHGKT